MIRKFHASTTRDALRMVRDALGANAIILSNRQLAGGIEIMAVADMDMARLTQPAPPVAAYLTAQAALEPAAPQPPVFQRAPVAEPAPVVRPAPQAATPIPPSAPARTSGAASSATAEPEGEAMAGVMREIRMLRGLLEGQLAGLAWKDITNRDPSRVEVLKTLMGTGFSPTLTRTLVDRMPEGDADRGVRWVRSELTGMLSVAGPEEDLITAGGVYALVGPTGVGKTTTVAKLAARAVLRHGPEAVALITTDSYRIGAHEQLRIYGRILGVAVYAVKDEADLQLTLADLAAKHLVFIDTVGMSQRDRRLAEQAALLSGGGRPVSRLLLLGATSQAHTLEDVVRAYHGAGLAGCILTKIDESLSLGAALDAVIRHQLKIFCVTNGQRVPEDLHLASALYLVDRAFRLAREASPFNPEDEDFPLLMAETRTAEPVPVTPGLGI